MYNFLFGPYPAYFEIIDTIFLIDALGAFLLAIFLWLILKYKKLSPPTHKLISRLKNLTFVYGSLGLLWAAIRHQHAYYLNWRFWMILIMSGALVWLAFIIKYWLKDYPAEKKEWQTMRLKEKYLR